MAYYLSNKYKRYNTGGVADGLSILGKVGMQGLSEAMPVVGTVTSLASGLIDAVDKPNQYGERSKFGSAMSGLLSGGPLGLVGSLMGHKRIADKAKNMRLEEGRAMEQAAQSKAAAAVAQDPSIVYGVKGGGFFENGGPLTKNYLSQMGAVGGSLKPMSSESVEVQGPSHEGGGVKLPHAGAEVEGNETIHNDFVFSDKLGFAEEHKRIAKSIGKIENKGVMSPERVNAIQRLEERQENLKLSQEYFKQMLMS